jgi:hypothetical protein
MFDHAKANPEYFSNFNMALTSQGIAILFVVGIFPFREELSKLGPKDDTVLVVDVGGGLGHATKQIKELIGDLKGRVILQDRPIVIEDIKEDLGEIEKMGHDFFTPNPVKGRSHLCFLITLVSLTALGSRGIDILYSSMSSRLE